MTENDTVTEAHIAAFIEDYKALCEKHRMRIASDGEEVAVWPLGGETNDVTATVAALDLIDGSRNQGLLVRVVTGEYWPRPMPRGKLEQALGDLEERLADD